MQQGCTSVEEAQRRKTVQRMLAKINRRSLPRPLGHCLNNRATMGSLNRKQWPDFITHAVAALNMGWSLDDSKPNPEFEHTSSVNKNEELKTLSHVETEPLQDENDDFDLPQKSLHSSQVCDVSHRGFHSRL